MTDQRTERREAESTPEEILISTSARFNELSLEAAEELYRHRNPDGYVAKLRERTKLIEDLSDRIKDAIDQGHQFPSNELFQIYHFAGLAKHALSSNGSIEMKSVLSDMDSKVGDPNNLEQLIERLYPQKLPPKTLT